MSGMGRNLPLPNLSTPEVRRAQVLQEIGLAERYAGIAEDGIGGRRVEKEIGKREARQILTATETVAHAVRELDNDFPIFAAFERSRIEAPDIVERASAALFKF